MFLVIVSTILDSISDIIYKKSLAISEIKPTVFQYFWEILGLPIVLVIMVFMGLNISHLLSPLLIGVFIALEACFVLHNNLGQYLYKNEKLSTLMPYLKVNNFIIVITGFLFFRDSSLVSFAICIGAVVLTTIASVDFKSHAFPKNFWLILLQEVIKAADLIISVWLLKMISTAEYVIVAQIIYLIVVFFFIWFSGGLSEFKKFTPQVVKYKSIGYMIGFGSYFIDLFLLQEFGVVISTLFGFFGSSLTLALAYFFLKEVPEKKEIALAVVMIALAGLGYYFR